MKLLANLSTLTIPSAAALGWRLQGLTLAIILAIAAYAFVVWMHDWEVREIVRRDLAERAARRIGG